MIRKNLFGSYRAIVTDTDCFAETGTIKTRISIFNDGNSKSDLFSNFDKEKFEKDIEKDTFTRIFLPFGGGKDYGMFKLPQVNSIGIVQFIDGNAKFPIWMGSFSTLVKSDNSVKSCYPTDLNKTLSNSSSSSFEDENSFVIKTKTLKFDDEDLSTGYLKNYDVENSMIMNSKKLQLKHNGKEYKSGALFEDDNVQIFVEKDSSNNIKIDSNGTEINSSGKSSISSKNYIINLKSEKENVYSTIEETPSKITISVNNKAKITLKNTSNGSEVGVSADTIKIGATNNLVLGSSGSYLVASPVVGTMTLEDGTILKAIENIQV